MYHRDHQALPDINLLSHPGGQTPDGQITLVDFSLTDLPDSRVLCPVSGGRD